jgi:hypothetical protein
MFPGARTDVSAIKSKRTRQLTIDFAKNNVKRPKCCRDISEHGKDVVISRQLVDC